jgi:hypothetical protein
LSNVFPELRSPFNDDAFIGMKLKSLIEKHGIKSIIETGSGGGDSSLKMAELVAQVYTIEIDEWAFDHINPYIITIPNLHRFLGESEDHLPKIIARAERPVLFYLDAHSDTESPILNEISMVRLCGPSTPVILAIHDFQVPGTSLGYCTYHGKPLGLNFIRPALDDTFTKWKYEYNSDKLSSGSKRGVCYIEGIVK